MLLGIVLGIIAAVLFGVTITIQKYSLEEFRKFTLGKMVRNKHWLSSIAVGFVGALFYIQALSTEQLSTIQPMMSSISMLVPVFFGAFFLREKMGGRRWVLIGVLVLGIIILGL